jgi:uncharacterized protein YbaP (TraB family)
MKRSLLILLGCLCSLFIFAQTNAPTEKSLLWRISGKNLSKPSYLYGTMHLTDERLFNLSDSLLLAIEKSEGFAIEIEPDEMITVVMEEMFNDFKKGKLLKDVVSDKAFEKYAPLLAKKVKKEEDELTVKDVLVQQNKWMAEAYKKSTMPTFLDIWLYDVARRQGKWVGGIEDMQDQAGLLENVFNEQDLEFLTVDNNDYGKKYLNYMIDTYVKQDITGLEASFNGGDPQRKDALLLHRNIKMARRMDSLSAIRTMVFAIGAGHLAGDSGVISLLRQKGFVVEPVFSGKKISGKSYKMQERPIAWQKFKDANGFYEAEMPGKASPLKMFGLLEMRMNIDLFNSSGYLTMAIPSSFSMENPDSILLSLARKMLLNEQLKQGKPIEKNGLKGREYFSKGADGFKRAQVFSSGQTIYVAAVFFNKEAPLTGADATRFFESLVLYPPENKPAEWVSFSNLLPGLQGSTPVKLERNPQMAKQIEEKNWQSSVFTGMDMRTSAVYMLIDKTTINDSYLPNDSIYLDMLRRNTASRSDSLSIDTLHIDNGIFMLEQKGFYESERLRFHSKTYVKGNRSSTLMTFVPNGKENETMAAKVLSSFKMMEPPASKWATHASAGEHFSSWAPNQFVLKPTESEEQSDYGKTIVYNTRDTGSSYVYSVLTLPFDTTTWYNGADEYWELKMLQYQNEEDSIISKVSISTNGLNGYLLQVIKKAAPQKAKLYRLFNYGDTAYTLFACVPFAEKDNADIHRFFTDIKFSRPAPATTVLTSKAQQFIGRLYSADSATHGKSYNGLYEANFSKKDIPLLRDALLEHYGWDTSYPFYRPVQTGLGDKLRGLGDSTLSDFIKANYDNRNGRDDEEQTSLLALLLKEPTAANMRFAIDGLSAIDANNKIDESALMALSDSIELLKPILSDALRLLDKKNMTDEMTTLASGLLDSNLLQATSLLPYEPAMLAFGHRKLQELNAESDGWGYPLAALSKVAGRLKTPASMGFLKQMLGSKHNAIKMESVYGLLEAEAPLPENVLQSIASDRSLRGELREALTGKKKENLFPKAFKTQQLMGESAVYSLASDDDTPYNIAFLSTQKATINDKPATVYFYKIVFSSEENKTNYLGAVAFSTDLKNVTPLEFSATVYWDEEYSTKTQAKQTKALLEKMKEIMKPE